MEWTRPKSARKRVRRRHAGHEGRNDSKAARFRGGHELYAFVRADGARSAGTRCSRSRREDGPTKDKRRRSTQAVSSRAERRRRSTMGETAGMSGARKGQRSAGRRRILPLERSAPERRARGMESKGMEATGRCQNYASLAASFRAHKRNDLRRGALLRFSQPSREAESASYARHPEAKKSRQRERGRHSGPQPASRRRQLTRPGE